MEILIVGALVVALMVYISTKIKRSAAEAFVPELVEKDDFSIAKPEGFMTPLRESSEYLFEAYSRGFGEKKTRNVWQAHALLTAKSGANFKTESERAKKSVDKITFEKVLRGDAGGEKICLLEGEKIEDEIRLIEFRKIVEARGRGKIYDLRISILPPFRAEFIGRINEMMGSLQIK